MRKSSIVISSERLFSAFAPSIIFSAEAARSRTGSFVRHSQSRTPSSSGSPQTPSLTITIMSPSISSNSVTSAEISDKIPTGRVPEAMRKRFPPRTMYEGAAPLFINEAVPVCISISSRSIVAKHSAPRFLRNIFSISRVVVLSLPQVSIFSRNTRHTRDVSAAVSPLPIPSQMKQ